MPLTLVNYSAEGAQSRFHMGVFVRQGKKETLLGLGKMERICCSVVSVVSE